MDSNKTLSLSPKILLEIEEALNYPRFSEISIGATLTDDLMVSLYHAGRVWNWRARVKNFLRYRFQRLYQPSFGTKDLSEIKGRIVFTWQFDRADLKALVLPLVANYSHEDSVVLGALSSMQAQLADQTSFVSWNDFSILDMKAWRMWRREFDRCLPMWRYRLQQVLAKHAVPPYVAEFLLSRLHLQTKRIIAANQFLNIVRPKMIVTECARSGLASCLVLAARKKSIPTITMIHGAMEPYPSYGFAPIITNYVCCWGEIHKNNFMAFGTNQEQLIVTGCHSMTRAIEIKQDAARLKIGLPVNLPVVLLATSPIKLEDRKKYTSAFCVAMTNLPGLSAIIRLHPAENIADYRALVDEFPKVKFLPNLSMSRDESLAAVDLVVSHESSFGIDALIKRKLLIILNVLNTPLKVGKELVELAGCPAVSSPGELESVIREIFASKNYRKVLRDKADQYVHQYCNSFGHEAVNNVCGLIDYAINSDTQKIELSLRA